MPSELLQKRIWEGWLSAEIRAYYFGDLAEEYHRRQRIVTWVILFLSSGALVTLLARLPHEWAWLTTVLVLLTAGLSLFSIVAEYPQRASESADLHVRWSWLAREYQTLWDNMYADDALARLYRLADEEDRLSKPAMKLGRDSERDKKRLLKWQDHVEKRHQPPAAHAPA